MTVALKGVAYHQPRNAAKSSRLAGSRHPCTLASSFFGFLLFLVAMSEPPPPQASTSSDSTDTPALALLAKQKEEIRELFMSPLPPQPAPSIRNKGDTRGEGGPEHLVILVHGLDGTPNDLAYVKRTIEGKILFAKGKSRCRIHTKKTFTRFFLSKKNNVIVVRLSTIDDSAVCIIVPRLWVYFDQVLINKCTHMHMHICNWESICIFFYIFFCVCTKYKQCTLTQSRTHIT